MYFKNFPKIFYDFKYSERDVRIQSVIDITTNVRLRKEFFDNVVSFDYYDIKDGETPEILAEKFYGSAELHWIIMLSNDRYDYIEDFPMSVFDLEKYIEEKYGDTKYDIKYYTLDGFIVSQSTAGAGTISNYDWEFLENDRKRRIKLFSRDTIKPLIDQYNKLMQEARNGV